MSLKNYPETTIKCDAPCQFRTKVNGVWCCTKDDVVMYTYDAVFYCTDFKATKSEWESSCPLFDYAALTV